jgi:hypothetical protein
VRDEAHRSGRVLVTRVGLVIPNGLPYDGWEQAGERIVGVMDSSAWCLGDWVVYGESQYADRYRTAVERMGLEYQTIRNYAWVARRFDKSRRRPALSFQHHAEVASLSAKEQEVWLTRAEHLGWSRNELRKKLRVARGTGVQAEVRVLVPVIKAEPQRLARWRAAAARSDDELEDWIVLRLDAAAAATLAENNGENREYRQLSAKPSSKHGD